MVNPTGWWQYAERVAPDCQTAIPGGLGILVCVGANFARIGRQLRKACPGFDKHLILPLRCPRWRVTSDVVFWFGWADVVLVDRKESTAGRSFLGVRPCAGAIIDGPMLRGVDSARKRRRLRCNLS